MQESFDETLLSPACGHLNQLPIVRGAYVYAADGKQFIDFTSGIGEEGTGIFVMTDLPLRV